MRSLIAWLLDMASALADKTVCAWINDVSGEDES